MEFLKDHAKQAGAALAGLLLLIFVVSNWPVVSVQAGTVGVVTWGGSPEAGVLQPGYHFLVPVFETVHSVDVTPNTDSETGLAASTEDQQDVTTSVSTTFNADPASAVTLYSKYGSIQGFINVILGPIVQNDVKEVTAHYDAQDLITQRDVVRSQIEAAVRTDVSQYGVVTVTGLNITDFQYSEAYNQAIEAKQVAQQAALQQQYTLQGVQIQAQQQVAQAQAAAEANVAQAKGDAQATLLRAQADAEAYALKAKSLSPLLVQQELIEKWDGSVPQYSSSANPQLLFGAIGPAAAPASP